MSERHHHKPVTYQPLEEIRVHVFDRRRPRRRPHWISLWDFLRYLLMRF